MPLLIPLLTIFCADWTVYVIVNYLKSVIVSTVRWATRCYQQKPNGHLVPDSALGHAKLITFSHHCLLLDIAYIHRPLNLEAHLVMRKPVIILHAAVKDSCTHMF